MKKPTKRNRRKVRDREPLLHKELTTSDLLRQLRILPLV